MIITAEQAKAISECLFDEDFPDVEVIALAAEFARMAEPDRIDPSFMTIMIVKGPEK